MLSDGRQVLELSAERKSGDQGSPDCYFTSDSADRLNVLCLEALGAAHDVELNALRFLKAAEAIGVDRREVNEDVFVVAIASDESKALCVVEPLDNTLFHDWCSFVFLLVLIIRLKISRKV
jgi:hypothetical protein